MRKFSVVGLLYCVIAQSACAAPGNNNDATGANKAAAAAEGAKMTGVENLPYARGRSFGTLDEYLAYLEQYNGPVDLPWWRQIEPGVYRQELRIRASDIEPEVATRAELARRFGFSAD